MIDITPYTLILASASPRRHELLSGLGLPYEIRLIDNIEESYPPHLTAGDIPLHLAIQKAEAYLPTLAPNELLLTADTIVWIDHTVLGKPTNEAEAAEMLHILSGRTHQVYTGVALTTLREQHSFTVKTDVHFATLTPAEIEYYVHTYHPLDKAGSYGVQEWIGYVACTGIEGSFYNVMGLPVQRLYQELKAHFTRS
jgi:septum formation protein